MMLSLLGTSTVSQILLTVKAAGFGAVRKAADGSSMATSSSSESLVSVV